MARGYNVFNDVLNVTVDGRDLNEVWDEFSAVLGIYNDKRTAIANLFTFRTDLSADVVMQVATQEDFEEATEFGIPQSMRPAPTPLTLGFPLKWYDARKGFTWRYLNKVSTQQLQSVHNSVIESDNRLVFNKVMRALLYNTRTVNENGVTVYPLWDGTAQEVPPPFAGQTFSTHNHYLTAGSTTIDGVDLRDLIVHVQHHGYGVGNGEKVIILCNPQEGVTIRGLRAGVGTPASPYDFIPSTDAPAYITTQSTGSIIGDRPPGDFNGLKIIGSFGDAWVAEDYFVPAGYVIALATSGPNSQRNPLAFREDVRVKGLIQIPGNQSDYPLIDSFYTRAMGVGVRHRGAAAVMQVVSGTYTPPSGF
jgi:hypothetical protein